MRITLPTPNYKYDDHASWPRLLPIFFVAHVLRISPWTLRQWDKKGKLPAIRIGDRKDRRYKKEVILGILQNGL